VSGEPLEVARFYRITKYPKVMGRFYDGTKIPGGPYTMTQGVTGAIALFLVINTNLLWTRGTIFLDLPLGAGIVYGIAYLAGQVRVGNRNPTVLLHGLWRATTTPLRGTYNDRPLHTRGAHRAAGRVITDLAGTRARPSPEPTAPPADVPTPLPVREPARVVVPAPSSSAPRAVSAVERLLAQSGSK
jgi:hypothetical protein